MKLLFKTFVLLGIFAVSNSAFATGAKITAKAEDTLYQSAPQVLYWWSPSDLSHYQRGDHIYYDDSFSYIIRKNDLEKYMSHSMGKAVFIKALVSANTFGATYRHGIRNPLKSGFEGVFSIVDERNIQHDMTCLLNFEAKEDARVNQYVAERMKLSPGHKDYPAKRGEKKFSSLKLENCVSDTLDIDLSSSSNEDFRIYKDFDKKEKQWCPKKEFDPSACYL